MKDDAFDALVYSHDALTRQEDLRRLREQSLYAEQIAMMTRSRVLRTHGQIVGLLEGNPAANAAERLRHLHIEELLAA